MLSREPSYVIFRSKTKLIPLSAHIVHLGLVLLIIGHVSTTLLLDRGDASHRVTLVKDEIIIHDGQGKILGSHTGDVPFAPPVVFPGDNVLTPDAVATAESSTPDEMDYDSLPSEYAYISSLSSNGFSGSDISLVPAGCLHSNQFGKPSPTISLHLPTWN